MGNTNYSHAHARLTVAAVAIFAAALLCGQAARAATWKGLEPFVSKRADVERVLGTPVADKLAENGTLQFNVTGGTVTVFFVTPKFAAAKKLSPELEGTVLQIVLQHERASDTPETLNVLNNSAFQREAKGSAEVYTNTRDGIVYTFVEGKLRTTRFSYSAEQLARIQRKG